MHIRSKAQQALYDELAGTLRSRILSGEYARGQKLPSEAELMEDTGLSRSTVRHALEVLLEEVLIVKERGRGAFVSQSIDPQAGETTFSSFTARMEREGKRFETRLVDARMSTAPNGTASFLELTGNPDAVELIRLRYLDGEPFCLETTYLSPDFSALLDEDLDRSLYAVLRERYHRVPARGHKTFEICSARQNEAFLLDVDRGTPLMLVTDFVLDTKGDPLHVSKRVMRTDRTKYVEPIG